MQGLALRDGYEALQKHGVEVFGVSFDGVAANKKFAEEHAFPFKLLSDTDRSMGLAFGAAKSKEAKYAKRIAYLLDPGGKVLFAYEKVNPKDHLEQVLADLEALHRN